VVQSTEPYFAEHETKVRGWHEGGTGREKGILAFAKLLGDQVLFRCCITLPVTKIGKFPGKVSNYL
jgi:hypothetical protein